MSMKQMMTSALAACAGIGITASALAEAPDAARVESPQQWFEDGAAAVDAAAHLRPNRRRAKNVILFVGDGMGVSTVTAARILEGQLRGQPGEENQLSFERLPYLALAKTYNTNQQTPDSAGTMTAMMSGVKTLAGVIGINQNTARGNCASSRGNELRSFLEEAEMAGMATGVVTTARITHATPAATYAHVPERNWEADRDIPAAEAAAGCRDIARQLIEFPWGDGLEVAMGGGRRNFLPDTLADGEGKNGRRTDGRDLTAEWTANYANAAFVWNAAQFDAIDPDKVDHLLGLFESSHMEYEHDRPSDAGGEPALSDMTAKALKVLKRKGKKEGFFLHVESGRIDHGHHAANAYRALTDAIEFARAVKRAMEMTDPEETLIIVTADHSHVFTIGGYPTRGNPILGKVIGNNSAGNPTGMFSLDSLGLPYTTLTYANGPGYTGASYAQPEGPKSFPHYGSGYMGIMLGRPDLTMVDTAAPDYLQEAAVSRGSETHAGEDVAIYAGGPGAYLFSGVQEQNVIYHVMKRATRLDRRGRREDHRRDD